MENGETNMKTLLMAAMGVVAIASPTWGVNIVAWIDAGICPCLEYDEQIPCETFPVEWPHEHVRPEIRFFVEGLERVREVRFGVTSPDGLKPFLGSMCPGRFFIPFYPMYGDTIAVEGVGDTDDGCHESPTELHYVTCGYVDLDAPGQVMVVPHPVHGVVEVVDCDGTVYTLEPEQLAILGGLGAPGYNPCLFKVPVEETPWTELKHRFLAE
jgi:hypothetical protein